MKKYLMALTIFLLALAVRLPGLDTFFTADEFLWVDRSRDFLGGLLSPNYPCLLPNDTETNAVPGQGLACTLRTGHPGVLTMWTGAAGITLQWLTTARGEMTLLEFVRQLPTNPVNRATIAPVRLPTVVITALFAAAVYLLLLKLLKPKVALLAGILLTLDPFHIALSRVLHHDALSTVFIITAALSMMIYFGVERRRKWLVLAGVLSGIAMLSKSTGLFLIPFVGLLALWALARNWARGQKFTSALIDTVSAGVLWSVVAAVTFVVLWPAMWVIPVDALHTIYAIGFKYASGGHAKGVLFFNTISHDPGPFFYPATWLFRTNFWQMVGVSLALWVGVVSLRGRMAVRGNLKSKIRALSPQGYADTTGLLLWVTAFLFFFMVMMTLGEKKQDRYILPVYPMLDVIAAGGLWQLVRRHSARWQAGLLTAVLVVNGALVVWSLPYTFAYYNPLAGGTKVAAKTITIGWGEGLNEAAAYLNEKPNAPQLKVSSWYGSVFAPYFDGETIRYSDQKGNALAGNYIVFYVNQLQRHYPDDEIWQYINNRFSPEKTVKIHGVTYAWIFPAPGIGHYVEDQTYSGIAGLLGWDWRSEPSPDEGTIAAGTDLPFLLFWENRGKRSDEPFFVRLIGADGDIWAENITAPTAEFADAAQWRPGQIIEERGTLAIPTDTPPGDYALQIGFYTQAVPQGELTFPAAIAPLDAPLQTITVGPGAASVSSGQPMGELQLLTVTPDVTLRGDALHFDLRWIAPQPTENRYQAEFSLLDDSDSPRWTWAARPLIPFLPTDVWQAGNPFRSQWHVPLTDSRIPGGTFQLQLRLLDETGNIAAAQTIGAVTLPGRVRHFAVPQPQMSLNASLGDAIELIGVDGISLSLSPTADLPVTFYYRAISPVEKDYTVFVQLFAPDGTVVAQQDAPPQSGNAPTGTWTTGEIITDTHVLHLPENLSAGEYRLITGMYLLETGTRLPVMQTGVQADFAVVATWKQP